MKNSLVYILFLLVFILNSCNLFKSAQNSKTALTPEQQLSNTSLFIDANKEKNLGNYEDAKTLYTKCIQSDPNNAAAMYELANLKILDKDYKAALLLTKKAAEIDPENKWYQLSLAKIYHETKQFKEEANIYSNLVKSDPYNLEYYNNWAVSYLYAGKAEDAIKIYNLAEAKLGMSEDISIQKKDIYVAIKKYDKAIKEIENLIAKFPDESKYYEVLAELYMKNKQYDKALEIYNKILKMDPSNEYIHLSLANYYTTIGDKDKSFEQLKFAFANSLLNIDSKIEILYSYFQLNDEAYKKLKDQAFELCKILISAHPDDPKAHSIYADFLFRDKNYKDAREEYRKVIALDSSKYIVWEQLMICETELKDNESLAKESEKGMEIFPEQPSFYFFDGTAYFQLKEYEKAITAFNHGKDITVDNNPLLIQFYTYLGDLYYEVKKMDESDKAFEKALELDSNNVYVLNNYSYYLSERGVNLEKAERMSKKSNELKPNEAAYQDTYGWILFKSNKLEEAKKWIGKALENGGDSDAVIIEHFGDILYKLGKTDQALDYWKKAKEKGKGSDFLDKKIEDKKLY